MISTGDMWDNYDDLDTMVNWADQLEEEGISVWEAAFIQGYNGEVII